MSAPWAKDAGAETGHDAGQDYAPGEAARGR